MKAKLKAICNKYCKNIDVRLVFQSPKLSSAFSTKDNLSDMFKSLVVYKFCCASCNACYIGHTTRHFITRINEHLGADKMSHVLKHLNGNPQCKEMCDESCFAIIDSGMTEFETKIKEDMHIEWEKPVLNTQIKHLKMTLSL